MTMKLSGKLFGPHYVYALIDPMTKVPFYIGKGIGNRAEAHFSENLESVGMTPEEIFKISDDNSDKTKKINCLLNQGFKPSDIARVICRKINEEAAYTIESCLIKSIYGLNNLTNIQDGKHSKRFCKSDPDDDIYMPKLTPETVNDEFYVENIEKGQAYYVYALVNPETKKVFYVGKGLGNRVSQHFEEALKYNSKSSTNEKLHELSSLQKKNYTKEEMAIILAYVDNEELAYLIETLYIKFVIGYENLTNVQPGNCAHLIRAKDDWDLRSGFDIQKIVSPGAKRTELLDDFLGTGIDILLYETKDKLLADYPDIDISFSNAKVQGAGELAIDAKIDDKITLRIQARQRRTLQISLVAPKVNEKEWLVNHFKSFNAFPYKRNDFRFSPIAWADSGVTSDVNIAAQRAYYMILLAKANHRQEIPKDIEKELLEGLPFDREINDEEKKYLR